VHHEIFKPAFDYWTTHCRPHSVAMGNAFSFLKSSILTTTTSSSSSRPSKLSWNEFVRQISESIIDSYIRERIEYADKAIAEIAVSKIFGSTTNETNSSRLVGSTTMMITILTYRYSEAVVGILVEASNQNKKIHVVVVEDRTMLYALRQHNISCEFVPCAGLSYVLQQQKEITFVLLGASALMSDGCVWGSIGTAVVALAAHSGSTTRPPVLVCAETYKISNRVQLDSWIFNEQQHHQQQAIPKQSNEKSGVVVPRFNLRYDLTPAELVDGIITELGIVPPTSVAVLLREMNPAGTQK
jgi:translation initiation factor eIF-2B subunit delta